MRKVILSIILTLITFILMVQIIFSATLISFSDHNLQTGWVIAFLLSLGIGLFMGLWYLFNMVLLKWLRIILQIGLSFSFVWIFAFILLASAMAATHQKVLQTWEANNYSLELIINESFNSDGQRFYQLRKYYLSKFLFKQLGKNVYFNCKHEESCLVELSEYTFNKCRLKLTKH